MDCCDVAAIAVTGCVIMAIILIIVVFRYSLKGSVKNKEFSIKLTPPKKTSPEKEIKFAVVQDKKKKKNTILLVFWYGTGDSNPQHPKVPGPKPGVSTIPPIPRKIPQNLLSLVSLDLVRKFLSLFFFLLT